MITLTDNENKYYNKNEKSEFKLYKKLRDHFPFPEHLEELLIAFAI